MSFAAAAWFPERRNAMRHIITGFCLLSFRLQQHWQPLVAPRLSSDIGDGGYDAINGWDKPTLVYRCGGICCRRKQTICSSPSFCCFHSPSGMTSTAVTATFWQKPVSTQVPLPPLKRAPLPPSFARPTSISSSGLGGCPSTVWRKQNPIRFSVCVRRPQSSANRITNTLNI